jgi:branched-subunit amino acid ABC-type transport system permease component
MDRLIGVLIVAVPVGSVYALAAAGLVLTYRTSRVFNFAHGAVGMFSAYLFYQARVEWGLPLWAAALLVVGGFAPLMGLLLERAVFRSLRDAATSVKVVVTVGLLVALQGAVAAIWGDEPRFLPSLFPEGSVRVFGQVHLGFDQLGMLAVSLATLVLLGTVVRWTPFGLRVRASVDRRDLAELVGVNTNRVSAASWALGFSTAAVCGILLSPVLGLDAFVLTLFVIQAFAAALFGRLESFPLTLAGGLLVAFLEELASAYLPGGCEPCLAVRPAVPFALIFGLLASAALLPRSGLGRWVRAAVPEPSAPPPTAPPARGRFRWVPAAVLILGLAALAPSLGGPWLLRAQRGLAMAGVFAGLAILGGQSGQISLAHTAFAGTGAFVAAALTSNGVPFFVALALAGLAAVPVAVFVALPAIRLQGLHVALLSFGFGLVVSKVLESSALTGGTTGMAVARPEAASTDLAYFYVLLAVATALLLVARNLRRSPTGRVLAAIRDSEVAARAIGVSLPLYRLAVFALSAFMAGVAGGALGGAQGLVTFLDFHPLLSLMWLSVAVIGGLGSPWGPAVSVALWAVGGGSAGAVAQLSFGLGAMFLARNERGLAGLVAALPERLGRTSRTLGRAAAAYEGEAVAARGA